LLDKLNFYDKRANKKLWFKSWQIENSM
jgi:hypothetical protein